MSAKKKLLIISGALIAVSVITLFLLASRFFTPEPKFECVGHGQPSSGFSDKSQGNCPISIESYNKWRDWEYPSYRRFVGVPALVLLLSGIVVGIVGLTRKSPKKS